MGSRSRIGRSSMRQNATTGAPVRSEPKLGKAWAQRPSLNAGTWSNSAPVSNSAAGTTPWPPRPCTRTWNMRSPDQCLHGCAERGEAGLGVREEHARLGRCVEFVVDAGVAMAHRPLDDDHRGGPIDVEDG